MFSQLMSRFFGQQDSKESMILQLNQHWIDWLQPISLDKPAGEDLTYYDSFQEIKEEITKLSGVNYTLISTESETILKQNSKDIRVATYYCLARLHLDGSEGFADGLELLAGLLDKFGWSIYPSRHNIRKNAIEWLASSRFIDELNKLQPIPETCLTRIIVALNLIDTFCKELFVSEDPNNPISSPDLTALVNFFSNGLKQPINVNKSEENTALSTPPPLSVAKSVDGEIKISSQRDLLEQARKMAT